MNDILFFSYSGNVQNSDPSARPLTMDNDKTKNTDRDEIRKTTV